jgi:sulfur carrier protein
MNVIINGTARALGETVCVGEAVRLVTRTQAGVAVAVNDQVLSRHEWESTPLADGDRVEVLTAVQGG